MILRRETLNLGPIKHKYNNLTQEERKAVYESIILKEADNGSVVSIADKEDYLMAAEKQLLCKEMYEEVRYDPSYLMHKALMKIRKRCDININNLKYLKFRSRNLEDFICYLKYIKLCHVLQVNQLSLTWKKYFCIFRLSPETYSGESEVIHQGY